MLHFGSREIRAPTACLSIINSDYFDICLLLVYLVRIIQDDHIDILIADCVQDL